MSETNNDDTLSFLDEPIDDGGASEEETTPKAQQILETLTDLKKTALKDSQNLGSLLADPDIRAVLAAKQKGAKVIVKEDVANDSGLQQQGQTPELPADLEDMTNAQLAKFLVGNLESVVTKAVETRMKSVNDQLIGVTNFVNKNQQTEAQQQIEAARQKYGDFDDLRPQMMQVVKENGNLTVEEAYVLAKLRSGAKLNARTSSERPTHSAARPPINRNKTPLPPGKNGWQQLMAEGLNRVNIEAAED